LENSLETLNPFFTRRCLKLKRYAYNHKRDYARIKAFLTETFAPERKDKNWFPSRWEYMVYHPYSDHENYKLFGIWEDTGKIVGFVHYEMTLGEAFFQLRHGYESLKEEMFDYAVDNLKGRHKNGYQYLRPFLVDDGGTFSEIATKRGFKKLENTTESMSVFDTRKTHTDYTLLDGYRVRSLDEIGNDAVEKTAHLLWKGFNHEGEMPANQIEGRKLMVSAPNFDRRLNCVVLSPDSKFVAYAGIWHERSANAGYVEPVATHPDYRRLGLGRAAVLECIKRINELYSAESVYVGTQMNFYLSFGFKPLYTNHLWEKTFV